MENLDVSVKSFDSIQEIDEWLLSILRCPVCGDDGLLDPAGLSQNLASARNETQFLKCCKCERTYPIISGVPDMFAKDNEEEFLKTEADQWDMHAATYDEKRERDALYMAGVEAVVIALSPKKGDLILDAGCGTGLTIRKYNHPGIKKVIAFDISLQSLIALRKKMPGFNVGFVRGDISMLPFAGRIFDKVLCANTLQHVQNDLSRRKCVSQLARVGRSLSDVVVSVHNFSIPKKRAGWGKEKVDAGSHSGRVQYIYRFEKKEFRELLESSLVVDSITGTGLPLPYIFKLSSLSGRLENILRRFECLSSWAHMLVGVCHANTEEE